MTLEKAPPLLMMFVKDGGFYPIESSGKKDLKEEAQDHLDLNDHVEKVQDVYGNVLAERKYV